MFHKILYLQKLKYPYSVFFIVGNEFCERFSYYGMKSILSLYLKKKLKYTEVNQYIFNQNQLFNFNI